MDQDRRDRNDDAPNADMIARSMKAEQKEKQRNTTRRMNRLWIWFGVLVLVIILIWWIMTIGLAEDENGEVNGPGVENPTVNIDGQAQPENQIQPVQDGANAGQNNQEANNTNQAAPGNGN